MRSVLSRTAKGSLPENQRAESLYDLLVRLNLNVSHLDDAHETYARRLGVRPACLGHRIRPTPLLSKICFQSSSSRVVCPSRVLLVFNDEPRDAYRVVSGAS